MVGEDVFHDCRMHAEVKKVLVINRRPCGGMHSQLEEIIQHDKQNLSGIENLFRIVTRVFLFGISPLGIKEEEYHKTTSTAS